MIPTTLITYFSAYTSAAAVYNSINAHRRPADVISEASPWFYYSKNDGVYDGSDPAIFQQGVQCTTFWTPAGYYTKINTFPKDDFWGVPLVSYAICDVRRRTCQDRSDRNWGLSFLYTTQSQLVQICITPVERYVWFEYTVEILVYVPPTGIAFDTVIKPGDQVITLEAPGSTQFTGLTFEASLTYKAGAKRVPFSLGICVVSMITSTSPCQGPRGINSVTLANAALGVVYGARLVFDEPISDLAGPSMLHLVIYPPKA